MCKEIGKGIDGLPIYRRVGYENKLLESIYPDKPEIQTITYFYNDFIVMN